jgi:hypothetical protein
VICKNIFKCLENKSQATFLTEEVLRFSQQGLNLMCGPAILRIDTCCNVCKVFMIMCAQQECIPGRMGGRREAT